MLGPQTQPGLAHELRVAADDVELGVVEERVLVQVRRAEGQPLVVDEADLCVDVDGLGGLVVAALVERAREQPSRSVVGLGEHPELAARVVGPALRPGREQDHETEVVRRRAAQLRGEDLDELGRPEELALEVDEAPGRAERAHVGLEDPELASRERAVDLFGHGSDGLHLELARGRRGLRRR